MSVSIGWRPDDPKKLEYVSGGSSFHKALEEAFGMMPITLTEKETFVLRGIAACGHEGASELISAIMDKGPIIVEADW